MRQPPLGSSRAIFIAMELAQIELARWELWTGSMALDATTAIVTVVWNALAEMLVA